MWRCVCTWEMMELMANPTTEGRRSGRRAAGGNCTSCRRGRRQSWQRSDPPAWRRRRRHRRGRPGPWRNIWAGTRSPETASRRCGPSSERGCCCPWCAGSPRRAGRWSWSSRWSFRRCSPSRSRARRPPWATTARDGRHPGQSLRSGCRAAATSCRRGSRRRELPRWRDAEAVKRGSKNDEQLSRAQTATTMEKTE